MSKERILHLTLKKKWFDMIASGEKKEEYREVKPYWRKRLEQFEVNDDVPMMMFKEFDYVIFTNGYSETARRMKVGCKKVYIGVGYPKLGGNGTSYIIQLGKIISKNF